MFGTSASIGKNPKSIRTVPQLLGREDVRTTMPYIHVLNRGLGAARRPADRLLGAGAGGEDAVRRAPAGGVHCEQLQLNGATRLTSLAALGRRLWPAASR